MAELSSAIRQGVPSAVFGISDSFKYYLASVTEYPVLYVVKDVITAQNAAKAIEEFSGKKAAVLIAKDEIVRPTKAFSKERIYQRIATLGNLKDVSVLVTTPDALMQKFSNSVVTLYFEKGNDYFRENYIADLVSMGYVRRDNVESKGTFSVRGDVLEIFPVDYDNPIRVDFFGDTAESIRYFDGDTGKVLGFVDSATVIQATETVFSDNDYKIIKEYLLSELYEAERNGNVRKRLITNDMLAAVENKDAETLNILSCMSESSRTIKDIISKNTVVIFDEAKRIYDFANLYQTEFDERFSSLSSAGETFGAVKNNLIPLDDLKKILNEYRTVAVQTLSTAIPFFNPLKIVTPTVSAVADYRLDFKEVFNDISNWVRTGYTVYVLTEDEKKASRFCCDLSDLSISYSTGIEPYTTSSVRVLPLKLDKGFVFHEAKSVVIGSGNLFTKSVSTRKIKPKKQTFFTAPETGDYAVHEVHGIGRVLGNKKITTTEGTKDYVAVEYAGGDMLYVPVEQMDILTRYLGGEKKPALSKIGGRDFENVKRKVKESIKKMSFDLKKLYEERNALVGYKFTDDQELQSVFEAAFPFEDTPDQITANEQIKEDMTSGKVMDRLVCGDVGFGKTEVAFRAAFRAIANGKQVAMLAPTTILAEQHYNTAFKRFEGFGVKIACLNRFKTAAQQTEIVKKLKNGEVDFVIGTHKLLGKEIGFKDLGLLILDEEQRFGVEHKEKIKLLKNNVDTLTLTATPIPRTLHMSLSGIRSISTINTPPKKRLPVQTYVTEETDALIKDALTREKNRNGQSFILYNRVESIFTFAERIRSVVPDVKITVVHGRMEEKAMESNIMEFYRGETDVLISTTIIENGIDLPKANTLIVIDADRLGLSTLYQLKGRVGRSDRLAYAYFTFKREKILSDTAYHRLNAIVEFAEMGSGIKIAMRDLEIRGAGNVLGVEQHGHMDKIGYELYSKLLREELTGEEEIVPELDIRVSAFIPDNYIESNSARMSAYKEIAEIDSLQAENEVIERLRSEYGEIPEEIYNLINIAVVKRKAMKFGAIQINLSKSGVNLVFDTIKAFSDGRLKEAIDAFNGGVRLVMENRPTLDFVRNGKSNSQMLAELRKFLDVAIVDAKGS